MLTEEKRGLRKKSARGTLEGRSTRRKQKPGPFTVEVLNAVTAIELQCIVFSRPTYLVELDGRFSDGIN